MGTLEEFRAAAVKPVEKNGKKFLTFETKDNKMAVLPFLDALREEADLAEMVLWANAWWLRAG